MKSYTLVIGRSESTGDLTAMIPELPGAYASGSNLQELKENARLCIRDILAGRVQSRTGTHFFGVQTLQLDA